MENQQKQLLPNLNVPNVNGVGLFFAVTRSAITQGSWKREDFEKIQIVEAQLVELQKYFESIGAKSIPAPVEKDISPQPAARAPKAPKIQEPTQPVAQAPKAEAPVQAPTPSVDQGASNNVSDSNIDNSAATVASESAVQNTAENVEADKGVSEEPVKQEKKN